MLINIKTLHGYSAIYTQHNKTRIIHAGIGMRHIYGGSI